MQPFLRAWRAALLKREERRIRWSLDVDPLEV
jgi:primosomal protein N'